MPRTSRYTHVIADILVRQEMPLSTAPHRVAALGLALRPGYSPSILVAGRPLPVEDDAEVRSRGCVVEVASNWDELLSKMESRVWDVIATHQNVEAEGDGTRFVGLFKRPSSDSLMPDLVALCTDVPIVILPLPDSTEFAIYESAERWYLGDTATVPLWKALLGARDLTRTPK